MTESRPDPWWYYLHTNGDLIAKKFRPEDDSDFVRKIWIMRPDERESGYVLLVEAAVMGARMTRILELAKQWGMDGDDGLVFCERIGFICQPHESEAGRGYLLWHKDDDEQRTRGEGSSPLLALISYTRAGDFAIEAFCRLRDIKLSEFNRTDDGAFGVTPRSTTLSD